MSVHSALALLVESWDETADDLSDEVLGDLAGAVGGEDVPAAVTRVLVPGLGATHPVRRALLSGRRFTSGGDAASTDLASMAALLGTLVAGTLAEREADARLLAFPMIAWDEARPRAAVSGDLIRLPRRGAPSFQTPVFQFDGAGRPIPVVVEINRLLDADGDPWGVADWWFGANAWLGDVPSALLGRIDDADLLSAARAELAVD